LMTEGEDLSLECEARSKAEGQGCDDRSERSIHGPEG